MTYSIGQLAKMADSDVETVRYYERRGLMPKPPRTKAGYRKYSPDEVRRFRFIRRAKTLGFTLREIATLLRLQEGGDRAEVKDIAQTKLSQVEARIKDLQHMRSVLTELLAHCSGSGPVTGCPIIEALNSDTAPPEMASSAPPGPVRLRDRLDQ
ncbi:MerR family transcriptional regulator [Salinisphaera sp. PC39]|uniref:MerR family transcriptional regulator n=1 Tax=Salinisphaera sp. PC39 TaxID=1304156 RepID=UPI0033409A2E